VNPTVKQRECISAAAALCHGSASQPCTVEVVRDRAALEAIVPAWESLAANLVEPNPFYEPWMLLPALESHGSADLVCVLIWIEGALCGLFPFRRAARYKGLPLTALTSWRHSAYLVCTPLVRAGKAAACLDAFLGWLRTDAEGASAAEFRYLPGDGAFVGALTDALRRTSSVAIGTESFTRPILRKDSSAESYLQSALSREARKALRRKERRLQEHGPVARVALKAHECAEPRIAEFMALEASGWKGRAGSALSSSERERRFGFAVLSEAHRRGRLQLLGIDCAGRPIARCCNFIAGDGAYAFKTAYDEAYAYFSPGIMAEIDSIREFHRLPGVQWMDSITDPDNETIGRLWKHRRTIQGLLVAGSAWGNFWVSALPLLRWAKSGSTASINAGIA
jgi:CelD/BcsL family acetyltransferase involved in cellulose biosynthesis